MKIDVYVEDSDGFEHEFHVETATDDKDVHEAAFRHLVDRLESFFEFESWWKKFRVE